jgi:hypothetical protein
MRLGLQLPSFSYLPDVWDLRYLEQLGRDVVPAAAELQAAAA